MHSLYLKTAYLRPLLLVSMSDPRACLDSAACGYTLSRYSFSIPWHAVGLGTSLHIMPLKQSDCRSSMASPGVLVHDRAAMEALDFVYKPELLKAGFDQAKVLHKAVLQ